MPSIRFVRGTCALVFSLGWLPVLAAQGGPEARAAVQREDLLAFGRDFLAVDKAYTPAARTTAEQRLAELTAKAGTISDVRMVLSLAQIVALADNGHTLMVSRGSAPEMARVGIRILPFGDDFVVVQATSDHADLLGGRVVAINGVPIAVVRDSARTLTGGITSWRDRMAPAFLESPGQLQAMGLGTSATAASYRIAMPGGKSRDVTLTSGQASPRDRQGSVAMLYPASGAGWQSLLPADRAPWSLQGAGETMRRRDAPELDAMVIQLRANVNGQQPIADFLAESDSLRRLAGRKHIVLDMRMNGGGNLQASSTYRNRPATVWLGVLDDDLKLALSPGPQLYWAGVMDQVRIATGDGEGEPGAVVMRCENPCRDSRGPLNLRLNHAQHIARHPGDTGLSRIEQLTGQPQVWLSKKFQEIH